VETEVNRTPTLSNHHFHCTHEETLKYNPPMETVETKNDTTISTGKIGK
jgi:hypothetical protein